MIRIISFELNHARIDCLYDGADAWFICDYNHEIRCNSFEEASQKMDEAIEELLRERRVSNGL